MEFHVTLSRFSQPQMTDSEFFRCVIELIDEHQSIKLIEGKIRSLESTLHYLDTLARASDRKRMLYLFDHDASDFPEPMHYVIPVAAMSDEHMHELGNIVSSLGKTHYLFPRDIWVSDQDYCSFFGKSDVWSHGKDRFPPGNFVETIDQTVYEMHVHDPQLFRWSDVPRHDLFVPYLETTGFENERAIRDMEERLRRFWVHVMHTGDSELIAEYLTRLANDAREWRSLAERK